jgi:hypothetical protein
MKSSLHFTKFIKPGSLISVLTPENLSLTYSESPNSILSFPTFITKSTMASSGKQVTPMTKTLDFSNLTLSELTGIEE